MVEPLPRGPKALCSFPGKRKKEGNIRREGGESGGRERRRSWRKSLTYMEKLEHLHGSFKCEALF